MSDATKARGGGTPHAGLRQPLAGLRVLDLTRLLPGPYATRVLADLGAAVDKLEDPQGGDYLRLMPPQVGGMNAVFHALNHGKRSVVLDLKKPDGRAAFLRLLPRYDVLVESFRPGVMDRLGLGRDVLASARGDLVHCAISGYGQDGPMKDKAGHDLDYLARAGVLAITGPADGPPQVPGVQVADIGGGALFAVVGILAALAKRASSGEGSFVDVAMSEGSMSFATFGLVSHLAGLASLAGGGPLSGGIAAYATYKTKDGGTMALGALEPKFWATFCAGVGIEARMDALVPGPHQAERKAELVAIFEKRTRAEWETFARKHDCCLEPVLAPEELASDPQHVARTMLGDVPLAKGGTLAAPRTPIARDVAPSAPAPAHGEHTREVLSEAGFTDSEIASLR